MQRFTYTTVGGFNDGDITTATAAAILKLMQTRPTWQGVIISPDEEPGPDGAGQYPSLSMSWYSQCGLVWIAIDRFPRRPVKSQR